MFVCAEEGGGYHNVGLYVRFSGLRRIVLIERPCRSARSLNGLDSEYFPDCCRAALAFREGKVCCLPP